jgi:hypothetical protein
MRRHFCCAPHDATTPGKPENHAFWNRFRLD